MTTLEHNPAMETQRILPEIDVDRFRPSRSTSKARRRKDRIMRVLFTADEAAKLGIASVYEKWW